MTRGEALAEIDATLLRLGFMRDAGAAFTPTWRGKIRGFRGELAVRVEVDDLDFVRPPRIRLEDRSAVDNRLYPHLFPASLAICYLDSNAAVLDRYRPGGTVLWCLQQAERVVSEVLRGAADRDFAHEFNVYWGLPVFFSDLPQDLAGKAAVARVRLRADYEVPVLAAHGKFATVFSTLHRKNGGGALDWIPCAVIRVNAALTIDAPDRWPPTQWARLSEWLDAVTPGTRIEVEASLIAARGSVRSVALYARNGIFMLLVTVPAMFRKLEFEKSRPSAMEKLLKHYGGKFKVTTYGVERIDEAFVYGRNMNGVIPLAGKKILLIGCGTIGGYLGHMLAQNGAGTLGGQLILIDDDKLGPQNLGRHILGVPYLDLNKAEALAQFIAEQLPHISVVGEPRDILEMKPRMYQMDVVIDATGTEALSIAVNDFVVGIPGAKRPALLHVWILGNGAAAQGLLHLGPETACYKCLKPDLAGEGRVGMLRGETELARVAGCADSVFVPFPVSASVQAAALGLEMVLDWGRGKPGALLRNRVLNPNQAHARKDSRLAPSPRCPACTSR